MNAYCNKCFYLSLHKHRCHSLQPPADITVCTNKLPIPLVMSAISVDKPGVPRAFYYEEMSPL